MRENAPEMSLHDREYNPPPVRGKRIYITTPDVRQAASSFVSAVARALSTSDLSSGEASAHLDALLDDLFEASEPVIDCLPGHQGCHKPFWEPEPVRYFYDL